MAHFAYYAVPIIFALCLGLTIGLTYAPCYSGLCVEEFYPYETRLHIATFYALVAVCALALSVRALSGTGRKISEYHITTEPLPLLNKRLTVGGVALFVWIAAITGATTGYWWDSQYDFYQARGGAVQYTVGTLQLAAVGITGHWCDILVGLLILPISRGTILGRFFQLHTSTLLYAHKVLAYGLTTASLVHMLLFYSWLPKFQKAPTEETKVAFNIDNPTLSITETEERSYYYNAMMPSGMAAFICFIIVAITSLPKLRRLSYNTFYYTHIICSCLIFIFVSIHASTDFYFLLPGILLWVIDWSVRLRWLLRPNIKADVRNAGSGWFEITLPAWKPDSSSISAGANPLQTYYLNFPSVSKAQCHAFTVASIGSQDLGPAFIFRKSQGKVQKKLDKEWTWVLSKPAEDTEEALRTMAVRLEGPYSPPVRDLFSARQILCVVGGTGITGALSIAEWFLKQPGLRERGRFRLVWTVRTEDMARLRQVQDLRTRAQGMERFDVVIHISSAGGGRLNVGDVIRDFYDSSSTTEKSAKSEVAGNDCGWVYCSGPEGLLESAESACLRYRRGLNKRTESQASIEDLSWYVAKWDV